MISSGVTWRGVCPAAMPMQTAARIRPARVSSAVAAWLRRTAIESITTMVVAESTINGRIDCSSAADILHLRCRGLEGVDHRLRIKTQPKQRNHHDSQDERFARSQIRQLPVVNIRTLKRALDHAQGVERGRQHSD